MSKKNADNKKTGIFILAAVIVCIIVIAVYVGNSLNVETASTIKREPLPAGSVNETAYFAEGQYLNDALVIEEGLKYFYDTTGVQPYVEVITSLKGSTITYIRREHVAYSRSLYNELFTDESHILLVFFYDVFSKDYEYYTIIGSNAKTVMDPEAEKILSAYIEYHFNEPNLSFGEIFSKTFSGVADRIMSITPSPWIPVLSVAGALILLVLLSSWLRMISKRRKLKAQQDMEILKKPLEQYGADTGNEEEVRR